MTYGKLINNKVVYAPYYLKKGDTDILGYNYEGNSAMLLADGYKPVEETTAPSGMKQPRKVYVEEANRILATWEDDYVVPTDAEISATRAALYAVDSDKVFASYQQGVAPFQDYVDAKAQIGFDNKKSTQTGMTLDDFKHKVSREYELFKQSSMVIKNTTFDYKESSGTDDLVVSNADISLIRPTTGVNVILPAIAKTQIVKIDNVSDDTVNISSANNEFIDGVGSPYTLQSKDTIEFIADVSTKSWDTYTAPLELESGINIEVEISPSASRNNATNLKFGKGFIGYTDPDKNGVVLEVQDNDNRPPSLYASLAVPEKVVGRGSSAIHRGVIWFDNVISAIRTNVMDLRKADKSYGIQEYDNKDPNVTGGQPYLVIFRPSFRGKAPANGFIQVALFDTTTGLPALDMNGNPLSVYKTYKEGDRLGYLRVSGIIKAKALQYLQAKVIDNFPKTETLMLNDYTDGNSCLVITALTGGSLSDALTKYELDTGENLLISKHYLGEIYEVAYLLHTDIAKTVGEAEQGETDADGSHLYNKYKMNIEVSGGKLIFSSTATDLCFFNWGFIVPAEITRLMRGKSVTLEGAARTPDSAINYQMVKWIGDPDQYTTKIITDNVNAVDVFEANWESVDKAFVAESQTRVATSKQFVVPDDANNIAFIVSPTEAQNPMLIEIDKFVITVDEPSYEYIIKGFSTIDERQMYNQNDIAKFYSPLPAGYESYRFSGNNKPAKLPVGELKSGDIPADLQKWAVAEGFDYGNERDLIFYDDANVTVNAVVNLWADKLEPIYFYLTNNGKEIAGSRVTYTPQVAHEHQAVIPTMSAKIQNGDVLGWGFETTSPSGAYLMTDDTQYPMAELTISTKGAV